MVLRWFPSGVETIPLMVGSRTFLAGLCSDFSFEKFLTFGVVSEMSVEVCIRLICLVAALTIIKICSNTFPHFEVFVESRDISECIPTVVVYHYIRFFRVIVVLSSIFVELFRIVVLYVFHQIGMCWCIQSVSRTSKVDLLQLKFWVRVVICG